MYEIDAVGTVHVKEDTPTVYETPNGMYEVIYHGGTCITVVCGGDAETHTYPDTPSAVEGFQDAIDEPWEYL